MRERAERSASARRANRLFFERLVASARGPPPCGTDASSQPLRVLRPTAAPPADEYNEWYDGGAALITQLVAEWSPIGAHARLRDRVVPALARHCGGGAPGAAPPAVLVPGAGLCRLAWDLASAGFNVEASDDSSQLLPRIKVTSRSSASEASALTL
jgi:hypothetical protein